MKILLIISLALAIVYAMLWFASRKTYPVTFGVSFNQNHAQSLGLDWKVVYEDMLLDLQPSYVRIAAMWSEVEKDKGEFDFGDVDWMMDTAAESGAQVTLVVGQKAPRWPECHVPTWNDYEVAASRSHLLSYVEQTVERYKNHEALRMWQVENEPYIRFTFGECEGYDGEVVVEEIALVKQLDPDHPVLVTDSGELGLWRRAGKAGDVFGTTIYRVVKTPKGTVIKYDLLPAALYRIKAFLTGISLNRMIVSELQAEPWFTDSDPTSTPLEEQEQTMNPQRMKKHIDFTRRIGVSEAHLWGVEWWYFMKHVHRDSRYWEIAKEVL
jgi:hypothetical protein